MSTLFVVPTPIGNLGDVTIRTLDLFKTKDTFICEDTRVTKKLFHLLGVDTYGKIFISNFEHNERANVTKLMQLLKNGNDLVLVSDAGTPLLSDPGFPLIRAIRLDNDSSINIDVYPGASSITTAMVISGFPSDKFTFIGFLPRKEIEVKKLMNNIKESYSFIRSTYIAFDTKYRLGKNLQILLDIFDDNIDVCICRELTKKNQSIDINKPSALINMINDGQIKLSGEIVLILRPLAVD